MELLLLAVTLMALMLTAGLAMAAPGGQGQGVGQGVGGGNITHDDPGKHTQTGGGANNNPHVCTIC